MIGSTLGHYEITGLLGRGGMGEVYRAHDTKLDRDVALKILPEELSGDPSRLERFEREAKTVAGLNHPHIVHVYSLEEAEGKRFLTMELVEGRELGSLVLSSGLPLDQVLEIGIAVASALADAHSRKIIHRDLKPANVMITDEGRVKVLDFGLAKFTQKDVEGRDDVTQALELTNQGDVVGTVPYMSPEQLRGLDTDHRSDLFALGILLHEIAVGRRPFDGPTAADVSSSILKDDPSPLCTLRPELPERLQGIVGRCLEKDREDRYASAAEIEEALRGLRQDLASGSSEMYRSAQSAAALPVHARRKRLWTAAIPFVVILAAWILWWTSNRESPPRVVDGRPVVAVLPFENLGGGDDEYFAAGITDEITSRLTLIDGLAVISRTSARLYESTSKSTRQVGEELGAAFVLEGSIRWDKSRQPERVRITPRLTRVEDDTNVWSENYEQDLTRIFEVQAAIAAKIAEALDITILASVQKALRDEPTQNIEAYQAYLQGMKQLRAPGFSRESFDLGVQMFERASALDPGFALAQARLSSMHSRIYHYGYDRSQQRLRLAKEAVDQALELQPDLAEARLALGHYYYWGIQDYDRALAELEKALQIEPNNSEAWLATAYVKRRQGDLHGAIELLERDRELSPLDPNVAVALGETYGTLRRYPEAQAALQRAIGLAPEDPYSYTELALLHLRWSGDVPAARRALEQMPMTVTSESQRVRFLVELMDRDYDAALRVLDDYSEIAMEAGAFYTPVAMLRGEVYGLIDETDLSTAAYEQALGILESRLEEEPLDHRIHAALGITLAGLERDEDAVLHAQRAVELYPLEKDALAAPVQIIALASTYTMLGKTEAALEQLDRVLSIPSTLSTAWLEIDPRWDPLRSDPGYDELLNAHEGTGSP